MGARNRKRVERVSTARTRWLLKAMRRVDALIEGAKESKSWSAAVAGTRQHQSLRLEYDQEIEKRKNEIEAARLKDANREMTPDERAEEIEKLALSANVEELEVFVRMWLEEIGHELVKDDDGELQIVRA